MDDKGPAFCVFICHESAERRRFYAAQKKFRFLLGCNEEDGWGCIDHFNEVSLMPEEGSLRTAVSP